MKYIFIFLSTILFANQIDILNQYRTKINLNPLKENKFLTYSAKKHSIFLDYNNIISHYEDKNYPYFFAITPSQRAIKAGYHSRFIIENISNGENSYQESIKDLFSAIYHRFGFLDFNIDEIGFAKRGDFFVYDMGNSIINTQCQKNLSFKSGFIEICKDKNKIIPKYIYNKITKNNPKVVLWPYKNMKNVPPVFYDEIPDPLPDYKVCGYPISISFNPYYFKNISLIYFRIDNNLPYRVITSKNDINQKLKFNQFVLFPLKRLQYSKKYHISAQFIVDNKIKNFEWDFYTEKQNNILEITKLNQKFYINPNTKYLLYIKPLFKNDVIDNFTYKYPNSLKIQEITFKDGNSIYIKAKGKGKLTLFLSNRKIELIIKK